LRAQPTPSCRSGPTSESRRHGFLPRTVSPRIPDFPHTEQRAQQPADSAAGTCAGEGATIGPAAMKGPGPGIPKAPMPASHPRAPLIAISHVAPAAVLPVPWCSSRARSPWFRGYQETERRCPCFGTLLPLLAPPLLYVGVMDRIGSAGVVGMDFVLFVMLPISRSEQVEMDGQQRLGRLARNRAKVFASGKQSAAGHFHAGHERASVVCHAERPLFNVVRARFTFSSMSVADAVQINGFGLWLCRSRYSSMA
jgi:hypothetical protein